MKLRFITVGMLAGVLLTVGVLVSLPTLKELPFFPLSIISEETNLGFSMNIKLLGVPYNVPIPQGLVVSAVKREEFKWDYAYIALALKSKSDESVDLKSYAKTLRKAKWEIIESTNNSVQARKKGGVWLSVGRRTQDEFGLVITIFQDR